MKCTNPTETIITYPDGEKHVEVKARCDIEMTKIGEMVKSITTYTTMTNYPSKITLYQCSQCKSVKLA